MVLMNGIPAGTTAEMHRGAGIIEISSAREASFN